MKIFNGKKVAGQQGFTLIELLVVIAILAVLATIAIPAYSRFFGAGGAEANAAELSHIQASMDAMMAHHRLLTVDAVARQNATDTFDDHPKKNGYQVGSYGTDGLLSNSDVAIYEVLHPAFLRIGDTDSPTKCEYYWNTTGFVTQWVDPVTAECHS